jgi:hypothetical protein
MNNKPIDAIQIKLIHIAKHQLGLDDEQYRALLLMRYFAASCTELTYDEATDLIKHFQTRGFHIVTKRYEHKKRDKRNRPDNIITLPSPQQIAMIGHLKEDVRWRLHDGFWRWLKKFLKRDEDKAWPALIRTSGEAYRVIEALKGMGKRQPLPSSPCQGEDKGGVSCKGG